MKYIVLSIVLSAAYAGWVKGPNGATCNAVCADLNLPCNADMQSTIDSQEKIKEAFWEAGYTCKSYHAPRDYAGTPFSKGTSGDDCGYLLPGKRSVCDGNAYGHHAPLCFCGHEHHQTGGGEGKWLLILNQDVQGENGYFSTEIRVTGNQNIDDPNANAYSIIGEIVQDDFKFDGRYQFRFTYDEGKPLSQGAVFDKIWTQTNWLMEDYVTGSSLGSGSQCGAFYGLALSASSFLDGNGKVSCWFQPAGELDSQKGGYSGRMPITYPEGDSSKWDYADRSQLFICTHGDCDASSEVVYLYTQSPTTTESPTPSPTPAPVEEGECVTKTIYESGPHKSLVPKQHSDPMFYLDMTENMIFSMEVTVNSIPTGWASVFHCGVSNTVRMPGIWLHPTTDDIGATHQGFTIVFSTTSNWNQYSQKATPPLYAGNTYNLEIKVTQSSFVLKLDDVVVLENHAYAPHPLRYHEPCYVGDPWYVGADVVIKNLEVKTDCVPERCYNIEGGPGIISGDPHTWTFAGVRHDFQGKPYQGMDQFYYIAACAGTTRDELPYQVLGRHVPYRGSTRVAGLDYLAIELFDDMDHRYVAFFSHAIHGYVMGEDTDYDAVKNLDSFTTLSTGLSKIGNRFHVEYTQSDSRNIHVILTVDGECDLEFTMYGQHDWNSGLNRYTMHYVRVNPPTCYKCNICGMFGDFQDYSMQTCDGRIMDGFGGWNNAWDERGWTWEKTFYKEHCPVLPPGATTTTEGPNATPSPVYIPPTDPPYEDPCLDHDSHLYSESVRNCHVGRALDDVRTCCDKIGDKFCEDLMTNCPFDACVLSDGDESLLYDQVEDLLVQPILEECDDLTVDSSDYVRETSQPTHKPTAKPTQVGIVTDAPTPEPTRSPVTKRPTQKPSHNPTTAQPTHRPTTSEPTNKPTHRPTTAEPTHRPTTARPTTSKPTVTDPTTSPTPEPSSDPTTAEPTKRPTHRPTTSEPTTSEPTTDPTLRPTTSDPTRRPTFNPTTADPTRRPTTPSPTERHTGWGAFKPTKPEKPTRAPKPTKQPDDGWGMATPEPTKGAKVPKTKRPTVAKTDRPTKGPKTPRPTVAKPVKTDRPTKGPKTPRPTAVKPTKAPKTSRPTTPPRTKAPKPTKYEDPGHGGDYGPGDEGNDSGYGRNKNTMQGEEMMAVDMNGVVSENTLTGYSAQTEMIALSSVVTVLLLFGCTMMCKRGKDDKYIAIEDTVV